MNSYKNPIQIIIIIIIMTSGNLFVFLVGLVCGGLWIHFGGLSQVDANKIWLIRHCHVHILNTQCCSIVGDSRSSHWGNFFMEHISKPASIMASGYTFDKSCKEISNLTIVPPLMSLLSSSSYCRNSQHMYLTAYAIYYRLGNKVEGDVNTEFCVGQERELVAFLKKRNLKKDVVVVWEHYGIVDILRNFGVEVSNWKNKLKDHYELVFWVDIQEGKWGYQCYEYGKNDVSCSQSVVDWLGSFQEADLNGFKYFGETDFHIRVRMIVVLGIFLGCGIGVVAFLICKEITSSSMFLEEESETIFQKIPIFSSFIL